MVQVLQVEYTMFNMVLGCTMYIMVVVCNMHTKVELTMMEAHPPIVPQPPRSKRRREGWAHFRKQDRPCFLSQVFKI